MKNLLKLPTNLLLGNTSKDCFASFSQPHQTTLLYRDLFCDSHEGSLLHVVQMAGIFKDSKTFVDMKMVKSQEEIETAFKTMMTSYKDEKVPKETIAKFVEDHFTLENQMEEHVPEDWVEDPKLVSKIKDRNYSALASDLNNRWKTLCRKIKQDVNDNPDRYSLLYLPNPVIVPGGRFREVYYWDTYWVICGLIQSEMYSTVRGILSNFALLIKDYGFIPNGGRSYYLNRSQPPMFIQMVQEYVIATGDLDFVRENIQYLEKEYSYWQDKHSSQF